MSHDRLSHLAFINIEYDFDKMIKDFASVKYRKDLVSVVCKYLYRTILLL